MDWRPYKLINDSERALIAGLAGEAASAWVAEWMPAEEAGPARCTAAVERAETGLAEEPVRWMHFSLAEEVYVAIAVTSNLMRALAARMFGEHATQGEISARGTAGILGDVLAAALGDLVQRVLSALEASADPLAVSSHAPASDAWLRGSGAVIVEIPVAGKTIAMLLGSPCIRPLLAARRPSSRQLLPLADPRQCIGSQTIEIRVWAGEVAVELGVLQTLAAGDVVKLDSSVNEPLALTVAGRETGRRAFLGCLDGRKAVQLALNQR
jgi:hypothetical protein